MAVASAVPGLMEPGYALPAEPVLVAAPAPSGGGMTVTIGLIGLQWETGPVRFDWGTGQPGLSWTTGPVSVA
jgi:hypothetical protein